jgi:thioredoxin-related protein
MNMKRVLIGVISILSILMLAGCSKKEIFISTDNVTDNTILVKRDGSLYVAIAEEFDKSYYNLDELNEFITKEVNAYNDKQGSKEVTIEELELKNGKAVMILGYTKMAHYSAFNNVPAAYFSSDTENVALELPSQYLDARKNTQVDKDTAFKSGKNQVLVLYEPYEIIVEGDIRYYSDNATLVDESKLKSDSEEMTVVIYKP